MATSLSYCRPLASMKKGVNSRPVAVLKPLVEKRPFQRRPVIQDGLHRVEPVGEHFLLTTDFAGVDLRHCCHENLELDLREVLSYLVGSNAVFDSIFERWL